MVHAAIFLVIGGKMFGSRNHTLRLNSLDERDGHARSQIRVFAEIFEIPAVHRRTINVHSWCENKIYAAGPCVLAHHRSDAPGECGVPGSGESNWRRVRGGHAVIVDT